MLLYAAMNALITGIAAFRFLPLRWALICPHDFIYLPALLSVVWWAAAM